MKALPAAFSLVVANPSRRPARFAGSALLPSLKHAEPFGSEARTGFSLLAGQHPVFGHEAATYISPWGRRSSGHRLGSRAMLGDSGACPCSFRLQPGCQLSLPGACSCTFSLALEPHQRKIFFQRHHRGKSLPALFGSPRKISVVFVGSIDNQCVVQIYVLSTLGTRGRRMGAACGCQLEHETAAGTLDFLFCIVRESWPKDAFHS